MDMNNYGSKFEMFLQRLIKKTLYYLYHVNIYLHWLCLLLIIFIIFRLTLLCTGWIQGLNTSRIDPLWIFHVYERVSFTPGITHLIVCPHIFWN